MSTDQDVTRRWASPPHVGRHQGDTVAANVLGEPREAHYEAVPRAAYTAALKALREEIGAVREPVAAGAPRTEES